MNSIHNTKWIKTCKVKNVNNLINQIIDLILRDKEDEVILLF